MRRALLAAVMLLSTFSLAKASLIAVSAISGGSPTIAGDDQLYGWIFDVNTAVTVTALGVYDTNGDGLSIPHDVGIYRQSDQVLLSSLTVPSGASGFVDSGFRFANLGAPVALSPDTYVIVMTMPAFNADSQLSSVPSFTTPSEISYLTSAFDGSSVLAFPDPARNGMLGPGLFGPNFEFETETIPEPGSAILVLAGIAGLLARRRFAHLRH